MLAMGRSPKEVIEFHLLNQKALGKSYFYTDQFSNHLGVAAHRYHTAPDLAKELRRAKAAKKLLFVGCAGTGASFTGITRGLQDQGFQVSTILVEPAGCDSKTGVFADHRFEGMAVGAKAPFLDWSLVDRVVKVDQCEMLASQRWFYLQTGIFVGNTSAACISVALLEDSVKSFPGASIVTVAYDGGLWYRDLQNSLKSNECFGGYI